MINLNKNINTTAYADIVYIAGSFIVSNTMQSHMNYKLFHNALFINIYKYFCSINRYDCIYYSPSLAVESYLTTVVNNEYEYFLSHIGALQWILFTKLHIKPADSIIIFRQIKESFETIEPIVKIIYDKHFPIDIACDRYLMLLSFKNMFNEVIMPNYNTLTKGCQASCDEIMSSLEFIE